MRSTQTEGVNIDRNQLFIGFSGVLGLGLGLVRSSIEVHSSRWLNYSRENQTVLGHKDKYKFTEIDLLADHSIFINSNTPNSNTN
jgi:hypothetical protein